MEVNSSYQCIDDLQAFAQLMQIFVWFILFPLSSIAVLDFLSKLMTLPLLSLHSHKSWFVSGFSSLSLFFCLFVCLIFAAMSILKSHTNDLPLMAPPYQERTKHQFSGSRNRWDRTSEQRCIWLSFGPVFKCHENVTHDCLGYFWPAVKIKNATAIPDPYLSKPESCSI